jgi:hypothetical protein
LIAFAIFDLYSLENTHSTCHVSTKKVLVVGCGRSGTGYIARFFQLSGLDVSHETSRGTQGCSSWYALAHLYGPSGLALDNVHFEHVIHQVRHPLDVISSWVINLFNLQNNAWKLIRQHLPEISSSDSLLVHCAKYWYYWNLKAEKIAEWRYCIEDLPSILPELEEKVDYPLNAGVFEILSNKTNTWRLISNRITWETLKQELPMWLFNELQEMAGRYGYSIVDDLECELNF